MEPGQVYPLSVRLYPTSNVFKKGHRLRVDLSSSNFPRFDVNPEHGRAAPAAPPGEERPSTPSTTTRSIPPTSCCR
jgi:predicted acyl esterase